MILLVFVFVVVVFWGLVGCDGSRLVVVAEPEALCAPVACELLEEDPPAACPAGWTKGGVLGCEQVPQGCSAIGQAAPVCADGSQAAAVLVCCCEGWGDEGYDCGTAEEGGAS